MFGCIEIVFGNNIYLKVKIKDVVKLMEGVIIVGIECFKFSIEDIIFVI